MAQFFRALFERKLLIQRLKITSDTLPSDPTTLLRAISGYTRLHDPNNQIVLFRLPQSELKTLAETPCPVTNSNPTSSETDQAVMDSSKRLRTLFSVKESSVCASCKFADTCSKKNIPAAKE